MRRRARDECDPAHHRIATRRSSGAPCCTAESPSADSAIGNRYSGYTLPRSSPPACQSGACHRRAWPAELTVQHAPTRHPSDRSDTSGDHDCISLGSQASTSTAPGRIRPPPLNPKDSADSRSFETDTKLWLSMTLVQSRLLILQLLALLTATGAIFTWYNKYFEDFYTKHPLLAIA